MDTFERCDQLLRQFVLRIQQLDRIFADLGNIHATDLIMLRFLSDHGGGPMTAGKLAEHVGLTSGANTAAIKRLEKAGLITRTHSEEDRRVVEIRITPEASTKVFSRMESIDKIRKKFWRTYTEDQKQTILQFLEHQSKIADQAFQMNQDSGK